MQQRLRLDGHRMCEAQEASGESKPQAAPLASCYPAGLGTNLPSHPVAPWTPCLQEPTKVEEMRNSWACDLFSSVLLSHRDLIAHSHTGPLAAQLQLLAVLGPAPSPDPHSP